jgi:dihydroorotase
MSEQQISIPRPDDWHVHVRDGDVLAAVIHDTAAVFGRAIIMPNLTPPITTSALARAYKARILAALRPGAAFEPLMTCYLTDTTDPADLRAGFGDGVLVAAKLYPAGATTNAEAGVTQIDRLDPVFEVMQSLGMPLLVHGEVVDPDVDVFDREAVFIERTLSRIVERFPALPVVLEHVTTRQGVEFVAAANAPVAATLTPHHLLINRNAMFVGGIRPHYYCLPVAKREEHRRALCEAATSGNPKFFLGTDSAPHLNAAKESACGCAGVYNAATALACYAQVFDEMGRLDRLADFAATFGAAFYGRAVNQGTVTLRRVEALARPAPLRVGDDDIISFLPDTPVRWELVRESR